MMTDTHAVTLTFNDPQISGQLARKKLKDWDARINRKIVGPRWQKYTDERMIWYFFWEKPDTNPHWHGLVQLLPEQEERFQIYYNSAWKEIVPAGDCYVDKIYDLKGAVYYATKEIWRPESYESFMMSLELH